MSDDERPKYNRLAWHLAKRSANRAWILAVLSTLTSGGHPFFHRSYRPVRPERKTIDADIENYDGFFSNLPTKEPKNGRKAKKASFLVKTKADRDKERLGQMNMKLEERITKA